VRAFRCSIGRSLTCSAPMRPVGRKISSSPPSFPPALAITLTFGHAVRAGGSICRAEGPEELRSLGETEFLCGVAAMSASAVTGRRAELLVGYVDLRLGRVPKASSDGRAQAIRNGFDGERTPRTRPDFDALVLQTQVGDVSALARLPTGVGGPIAIWPHAGKRDEAFASWHSQGQQVASSPKRLRPPRLSGVVTRACRLAVSAGRVQNGHPQCIANLGCEADFIHACVAARAENGARYGVGRDLLIPWPTGVQIPAELTGD
jgi:hypothetical protein